MVRVIETGLFAMLCVPGEYAPNYYKVKAKVYDGKETVEYTFGPHVSPEKIWEMLPDVYRDKKSLPLRKVKDIEKGNIVEVKKDDEPLNAVLLSDGTVLVKGDKS